MGIGSAEKLVKMFDTVQEGVRDEIDLKAIHREYNVKGKRILIKLVDEDNNTMKQIGIISRFGKTEQVKGMNNKNADIVTWARPGILIAAIKGKIKRVDGDYYDYDFKDAILKREIKFNSKGAIGGDIKKIIDAWEKYSDKLAIVLIRKGIYEPKDFGIKVLRRLKDRGYIKYIPSS